MTQAKILIVEDDYNSFVLCKDLLEKKGHSVLRAKNGKEGLSMVESEKPDLILLDILLPDMNGLAMIKLLKENPEHRNIPIVAVTCLGMPEDRVECLEAGCMEHIAKPIEAGDFVNTIERILEKTKGE